MIAFFCLSIFKRLVLVLMRSIVGRSPPVQELLLETAGQKEIVSIQGTSQYFTRGTHDVPNSP